MSEVTVIVNWDPQRWLRMCCDLEHAHDFDPFHSAAAGEAPVAVEADVSRSLPGGSVGNVAPAAFSAGASSEAA